MKVLQNIKIALGRWMIRRHHDNSDAARDSYVDLTRTLVKCALDNSQLKYLFDKKQDCFYTDLTVDGGIILALKPHANHIYAQAIVSKRPVAPLQLTKALLFCNKWNSKSIFPKAYIEGSNNTLVAETVMTFSKETSEEFVRECILKNLFAANIAFLEEAAKGDFLPDHISEG